VSVPARPRLSHDVAIVIQMPTHFPDNNSGSAVDDSRSGKPNAATAGRESL